MRNNVRCQCCGIAYSVKKYKTDMLTICPNCKWEQDMIDNFDDISYANRNLTVNMARQNIKRTGNIYGTKSLFMRKAKLFI